MKVETWDELFTATNRTIAGLRFEVTCHVCPEQYDVFDGSGKQVGYVRLRHGVFRVDYPDCMEESLIREEIEDDGVFEDEGRRTEWLTKASAAINERIAKGKP